MRVLITGAGGQLGRDLIGALGEHKVRALTRADLDVTNAGAVIETIETLEPDVVIHAAALTDTSRCEEEFGTAYAVNGLGARNVAVACGRAVAAMVYVSTNEVFDGTKGAPYTEMDDRWALNAYGESKLAGERLLETLLPQHYIVRTAWLYGASGNHFATKILRAAEGGDLTGVVDEVATPTWTRDLAGAIAALVETGVYGVYHFTNAGQASRYQWAREILELTGNSQVRLRPVTTREFRQTLPAGAAVPRKPAFSVLDNLAGASLGIELRDWREALAEYFEALD